MLEPFCHHFCWKGQKYRQKHLLHWSTWVETHAYGVPPRWGLLSATVYYKANRPSIALRTKILSPFSSSFLQEGQNTAKPNCCIGRRGLKPTPMMCRPDGALWCCWAEACT
jgi:hypothetical protein